MILDYEDEEGNRNDYLIDPREPAVLRICQNEADALLRAVRIFVAINKSSTLFLWPARLPTGESRQGETWYTSALQCADMAKDHWVRIESHRPSSAYRPKKATADWPAPEWGDIDFETLLLTAFSPPFLIDSVDHPVLRKLRGEI